MRADLLLLNANPLQSVANLSKREGVMVRGRWLPETELRQMLDNIAALNRAPAAAKADPAEGPQGKQQVKRTFIKK